MPKQDPPEDQSDPSLRPDRTLGQTTEGDPAIQSKDVAIARVMVVFIGVATTWFIGISRALSRREGL